MKSKNKVLLAGVALAVAAGISIPNAFAGTVSMPVNAIISSSLSENVTRGLHFGTIDLAPSGGRITLNASAAGVTGQNALPAVSTGTSIVTGGNAGLITVDAAMNMTITVTYPNDSVTRLLPGDLQVNGIALNSQGGGGTTIAHTGGSTTTIAVGGYIDFTGTEANGTHTANMSITLDYN